ncbi:gmuG [Mytilus coruscus]|uniref:GmuG n=1 Tax=Mytilus coruscus TaxID=42192 RepID=A0A6J8CDH9_MYTCO|nr:gmuG [Mytilus coruscus]
MIRNEDKVQYNMRIILVFITCLCIKVRAFSSGPIDTQATPETKHLYNNLLALTRNTQTILFGHHHDTLTGAGGGRNPYRTTNHNGTKGWTFTSHQVHIKSPDDLSDVKSVTGEYPAVIGFDIGHLDNLDRARYLIRRAANRGLIITISWHQSNPISDSPSAYVSDDHTGVDIHRAIHQILPHGNSTLHSKFTVALDKVAAFIISLKDSSGHTIPVIFRPYHEMNGAWFWWGTNSKTGNTPYDYKMLFQFVVKYLKNTKQVHNIIYAYSPGKSLHDYLKFYPGDSHIDLLGLDFYFTRPFDPPLTEFQKLVNVLTDVGHNRNKIAALTEVGMKNSGIDSHPNFWSDHVLVSLKNGNGTTQLCYMLTWANRCSSNSCDVQVPYQGHPASSNFFNHFYKDPLIRFGNFTNHTGPSLSQIVG